MKNSTKDLIEGLKNAKDINKFMNEHKEDFFKETLTSFLNGMLAEKKMSVAAAAEASGVGEYAYKVFSGERRPSREVLIALASGIKLSFEETQVLLRISGFAILDPRDKRDSVIIYAITHNKNIPDQLNEAGLI